MFIQKENFGTAERLRYNFQIGRYDYPAHIHQYAEIGYVISGSLEITVNGHSETAGEGDFILIFPMQVHEYSTPVYCDAIISAISNSLIPEFFSGKGGTVGESAVFRCCESVEKYFRSAFIDGELDGIPLKKTSDSDKADTEIHFLDLRNPIIVYRIKSILYAILGEYFNSVGFIRENIPNDAPAKILLYLNAHYTENIQLTEAAASLGYSANYLSHRIKKTLGMSFRSLLGNLRVEHAAGLLNTDRKLRMIDIALESGFANERSFNRTFKNVTGLTPSEYLYKDSQKIKPNIPDIKK